MKLFSSNNAVYQITSLISEIKKLSDDMREASYSWNAQSQHGPKIASIKRFIKQLDSKVSDVEQALEKK